MVSEKTINKRNRYYVIDEIGYLDVIRQSGEVVTGKFDLEDMDRIKRRPWHVVGRGVGAYSLATSRGVKKHIDTMGRIILDAPPDKYVSNANGDTLDYRKANLLLLTPSETQKRSVRSNAAHCPYKNIVRIGERWRAIYIIPATTNKKRRKQHIGVFDTPEAARDAREEWIRKNANLLKL